VSGGTFTIGTTTVPCFAMPGGGQIVTPINAPIALGNVQSSRISF
jgi:hypothetical protein